MPAKSKSSQKLLPRKPRVQIDYDVEIGDAIRKVELPWITGVMADLSGANAGELPDIQDRKFSEVEAGNFDDYLKSQKPRVAFAVENSISGEGRINVDVTFESLDDFSPDHVARKIGSETEDIRITKDDRGGATVYAVTQDGPLSIILGETLDRIDGFDNLNFVAYKLGLKPDDIEVQFTENRKAGTAVLRVVKKGPLAKLLDARSQLKELLVKVDGNSKGQKALAELLDDQSLINGILNSTHDESQQPS